MKYRVRLDLSFDSPDDAQALSDFANGLTSSASSINEGEDNEEISKLAMEICYHDEDPALPCVKLVQSEVRQSAVIDLMQPIKVADALNTLGVKR